MQKKSLTKRILIIALVLVLLFGIYIGWQIYKSSQTEVVSVNDIVTLNMSEDNSLKLDTEISGDVQLGRFEALSHPSIETYEGILYIILHKQPALISQPDFSFSLNGVSDLDTVEEIRIVSGDIYTGEGDETGYSLIDLQDAPEQKVIWKQP